MTTATQNQKDAFADLLTAACYTNPVPAEVLVAHSADVLYPYMQAVYDAVVNGCVAVDPTPPTPTQISSVEYADLRKKLNVIGGCGIGGVQEQHNRLINWTNIFFVSPNPPYQQQHIFNLMSTAHSVSTIMNSMGGRPHWDSTSVFNPINPDDVALGLQGGKFNALWYDDLLGSVSGALHTPFASAATSFEKLYTLPLLEYVTLESEILEVIDGVEVGCASTKNLVNGNWSMWGALYLKAYAAVHAPISLHDTVEYHTYSTNVDSIIHGFQSHIDDFISGSSPYDAPSTSVNLFNQNMRSVAYDAIDAAYATLHDAVGTLYVSMSRPIATLVYHADLINAQINREQWWWQPLTADIHFSQYSRASQVAVSGGVAISVQGMAGVANLNNMINRTASTAIVRAKDEVG